jgi:phosphoglycolate phosphatase-like HAD superfamily hydrolase
MGSSGEFRAGTVSSRLFLFDVDGTLVRLDGAGRRALAAAFQEVFRIAGAARAMELIRFDGCTDRAILSEAVRHMGLDAAEFARAATEFESSYLRHLNDLVSALGPKGVLPSVVALLETLEQQGAGLGLLTGNSEAGARAKLEPFGLNRFFPTGAFGSEHHDRVVLADLAHRRLEQHGRRRFARRDVFVLGDSVMDVRCGRAHGYSTVAVATGWTSRELLAAESPDYLLDHLGELLPALAAGSAHP